MNYLFPTYFINSAEKKKFYVQKMYKLYAFETQNSSIILCGDNYAHIPMILLESIYLPVILDY